MTRSYRAGAVVLTALLSLSFVVTQATAGGKGGNAPSWSGSSPPGFSSPGGHDGFAPYTTSTTTPGTPGTTTTPTYLPKGWGEGDASWKSSITGTTLPAPPGLSGR